MKNLKVIGLILIAGLGLTGCEEKNQEYYLKHIDSAKEKLEECRNDLNKAFRQNDEKLFEKIKNNTKCQAVENAIKEDRILQAKLEQERKAAEEKLALEIEITAIKNQIADKSWKKSINEYLKVEGCNVLFSAPSPKCKAWEIVYNEKVDEGKKELKQLSFEAIKEQMMSLCKLEQRRGSNCAVAQSALEEKATEDLANADIQTIESQKPLYCAEDIYSLNACRKSWEKAFDRENEKHVKFFTDNDDEFIRTFNSCADKIADIEAQNLKWNEKNTLERKIAETYPCHQAKEAYRKRGMGYSVNFEKKIEK